MRDKKKAVFNILFLLLVFGLTVYGVFRGEDLESMMHSIRQAQWQWLVPGVALVLFFIWSESIIIWYMMKSYGTRLKKRSCFLFSSVGFFFSCITPSASGGQPMQIYYMKKEKIPIPVSTVVKHSNAIIAIKEREAIMAKALVTASEAPLSMMELILEAMKLIDRISVIGSRIAISDAGVGITMCEAAMKGASLNVFINTKLMKDRELAEDMNFKADKMLAEAAQIEEETFGRVMDAVRP